jgi:hypothetical protein
MKVSKFRLVVSIVILAIASLTVYFLVQDIYRLQKEYEIVSAPLEYERMNEEQYRMIKQRLDEIQTMINLRKTAVVLVVAATAVTLSVLNKRKLFKQKYVATALILLLITFFQTPTVHARISQTGFWRGYAGVKLTIPQDSYLESVTGYITPRPDDVSEGFIGGYIEVYAHTPDWNDWIQAGYTTDIELGTVFYVESYVEDIHDINTAPGVSFFEKYLIHIQMEIASGVILWSAFIYDGDGNTMLKMENVFLRYSLTYRATAMAESTADCNGFEAEFSELEWKCFLDGEGYWDGTEGLTCTVIEDDPYFVKMKAPYYHFFASGAVGPKSLGISVSSYGHGTTNPVPGYHTYDCGEVAIVKAAADYGYGFNYWDLDGGMYVQNPIVITMIEPCTLEAHFKSASGGGGGDGGCPTLFVWNATAYVEEGTLDIHAESDVTVQHEIENALALENCVYKLQLRELDNHTSHIDQVKLYAVDDEGEWHLCPLIYAKHNDSYVTWKLLFDDENRINLTPTQTVNLKFLRSFPYSETTYFIFEINGYNRKTHT